MAKTKGTDFVSPMYTPSPTGSPMPPPVTVPTNPRDPLGIVPSTGGGGRKRK